MVGEIKMPSLLAYAHARKTKRLLLNYDLLHPISWTIPMVKPVQEKGGIGENAIFSLLVGGRQRAKEKELSISAGSRSN